MPVDGPVLNAPLVHQVNMFCQTRNNNFDCLEGESIKNYNRGNDLNVECQDVDPTNPVKDDGVIEMILPYEGAKDK